MTKRSTTEKIVIHCADTYEVMDIGAAEINQWHLDRGWNGIGYHFVIRRDGEVEVGRDIDEVGAHAKGYNQESIGICMVGGRGVDGKPEDNFTDNQWESLEDLVDILEETYPDAEVFGHNELNPHKACPSFDVQDWLDGMSYDDTLPEGDSVPQYLKWLGEEAIRYVDKVSSREEFLDVAEQYVSVLRKYEGEQDD